MAFEKIINILESLTNQAGDESLIRTSINKIASKDEKCFFERLATFNKWRWDLKPSSISPLICAGLGWQQIRPLVLQCVSCKKILSAQLPPVWNVENYNRCVAILEKALKVSHDNYCPWPLKNLTSNYLHEDLLIRDKSVEDFKKRLLSFLNFEFLQLTTDIPDDMKLSCKILQTSKLISDFSNDFNKSLDWTAIILALTGWTYEFTKGLSRVKCLQCLRNTHPSFYASNVNVKNADQNKEIDEPAPKQIYKYLPTAFHPITEHHKWCPWITAPSSEVEKNGFHQPGWLILYDTLIKYDKHSQEDPREVVLKVKSILNKCF